MSHEEQPSRHLAWDNCFNVRELGGYPVEGGRRTRTKALVRADNLYSLTPEGQQALRDYGVRTIIDLRLAYELEMHPNPFAAQQGPGKVPRYLNLSIHDMETDAAIDAAEQVQEEYILILEKNKGLVASIIEAVAAGLGEGGVVVHCHGGKDRTGIIVALLLSIVGVPRETIVTDYALSEARLDAHFLPRLKAQSAAEGLPLEKPNWMFARPKKMESMFEYLDLRYGGAEGYLRAAGVTEACITQLREHLIATAGDTSN